MGDERKPTSDMEACLSAIRAEVAYVLAMDSIDSTHDQTNLFDLGMDSLAAVELAARLRDRLHVHVGISTLFEAATISDLAALVRTPGRGEQ